MQSTSADQTLDDGNRLGTGFRPAEQPQLPPRVAPALRMHQRRTLASKLLVDRRTVTEQRASKGRPRMTRREREHHLVVLAVQWPVPRRLHLVSAFTSTCFYRRLIHRQRQQLGCV